MALTPNIPQMPKFGQPFELVWTAHPRFVGWYTSKYDDDELAITYRDGEGYRFAIQHIADRFLEDGLKTSDDLCSEGYPYPTLEKAFEACHRCYFKGEWRKPARKTVIGWDMGVQNG